MSFYVVGQFVYAREYELWLNNYAAQGYELVDVHILNDSIVATVKHTHTVRVQMTTGTYTPEATSLVVEPKEDDLGGGHEFTDEALEQRDRERTPRYSPPRSIPGRY